MQQVRALYKPYLKRDLETISNMPGHTEKDFRQDAAEILKGVNWRVQSHEFILMPSPADHIDPNDQASIRRFRNYCQIFINECFNGHFEISSRYKDKHGKFRYRSRYKRPDNNSTSRFYWMLDIQSDSSQNSRIHAHIMVINHDLKTGNAMNANYYGIQHIRRAIHHATEEFNDQPEIQKQPQYRFSDIVHHKKGRRATKNAQAVITALDQTLSSIRVKGIKALKDKLRAKDIEMKYVNPAKKRKHHGFKFRLLTRRSSRKHRTRTVKHHWIWASRLCRFQGAERYSMDGIKSILSEHRKKFSYRKYHHLSIDEPVHLVRSSKAHGKSAEVSPGPTMESSYTSLSSSSSNVESDIISSSSSMPSRADTKMALKSRILSESASVASFKRSCSFSANQAFRHAERSITDNQDVNSYLYKRINQTKNSSSNELKSLRPKWNSVTSKQKKYQKDIQSMKNAEKSEAHRVTRIMPELRKHVAYQFSYWYYKNIPEILEAEFQGYNEHGIPKFGITKRNASWFSKLVNPIINGFKNSEVWIAQKWQYGKKAIDEWMTKHYVSNDARSRNNNGEYYSHELHLSDIEDSYNKSGIIHKLTRHLPKSRQRRKRDHALVKRIDKRLQKYHRTVQNLLQPEMNSRAVSNKMQNLEASVRSASSESSSYSELISGQIAWRSFELSNINNKNNIANSLRSASASAKKAYTASVQSFELNTPFAKRLVGYSSASVTDSTAGLALNNLNKNLKREPLLKRYAPDFGIDTIKSSLTTRNHKHQESVKSINNDKFFKSSRSKLNKRREEHQEERHRGNKYSNNHSQGFNR